MRRTAYHWSMMRFFMLALWTSAFAPKSEPCQARVREPNMHRTGNVPRRLSVRRNEPGNVTPALWMRVPHLGLLVLVVALAVFLVGPLSNLCLRLTHVQRITQKGDRKQDHGKGHCAHSKYLVPLSPRARLAARLPSPLWNTRMLK